MIDLRPSNSRELADAYGSFFAPRDWTFFAHLTVDDRDRRGTRFGRPWTPAAVVAEFVRFHRRLATMAKGPITFVRVMEGASGDHLHIHALLGNCESLTLELVRRAWKAGLSQVERFDPARRGAYYATKFVGRDTDSIDFSEELPPKLISGTTREDSLGEVAGKSGSAVERPTPGCTSAILHPVSTQPAGAAVTDSVARLAQVPASTKRLPMMRGTLDLLVLKALAGGEMYASQIRPWLAAKNSAALQMHDSAIYQSLYRMADRGLIGAEVRTTKQGRCAPCYSLTALGRDRLIAETDDWRLYSGIVSRLLEIETLCD